MVVMRRTKLFIKTRREAPADEQARNAQLLIRAGYIHKEMAGVYSYLPLGLKVLENIEQVIREEMDAIGGEELLMSTLQSKELWAKSGRWHDEIIDVWFKTRLHGGAGFHTGPELGLGNTHEETLTNIMRDFVKSYKDLPIYAYQFQTKFRNEPRAKSGLLRCREFIMKDLYSFCATTTQHDEFYQKAMGAYKKVFKRLGIGDKTYLTYASGGAFTPDFSHEFQTVTDIGEDIIYVHEAKKVAVNKEVYTDENVAKIGLNKKELVENRSVEVGNIFPLGTRFSEALGLTFATEDGSLKPVVMGSYGIGPSRLLGLLAEYFADDKGLVWPVNIAPAKVYLAPVGQAPAIKAAADSLYNRLTESYVGVIYDDRGEASAGEMFADADLMGIPLRLVISDKTLTQNACELKLRTSDDIKIVNIEEVEKHIAKNLPTLI